MLQPFLAILFFPFFRRKNEFVMSPSLSFIPFSCKQYNNLCTFFAIIMGLNNCAVSRLTASWDKLSNKLKRLLSQFESLIDPRYESSRTQSNSFWSARQKAYHVLFFLTFL